MMLYIIIYIILSYYHNISLSQDHIIINYMWYYIYFTDQIIWGKVEHLQKQNNWGTETATQWTSLVNKQTIKKNISCLICWTTTKAELVSVLSSEDSEQRWVQMIEAHRIDNTEPTEIVFVWGIVPMPCYHIKWRMILHSFKQVPTELLHQSPAQAVGEKKTMETDFSWTLSLTIDFQDAPIYHEWSPPVLTQTLVK